jgi:hypothetical protein
MRKMKRFSWTQQFQEKEAAGQASREYLFYLDEILYGFWELGRNIILVWSPCEQGMHLLVAPHFAIAETIGDAAPIKSGSKKSVLRPVDPLLYDLVAGSKMVAIERLQDAATRLGVKVRRISLPFSPGKELSHETISSLVKRYSITRVEDRAVALFDIVGFSHYAPLVQVAQLNSLSYSVNTAYRILMGRNIEIRFARTNTGDGFYIWNRDRGIDSNVDLYHFMHLVLAENALARSENRNFTAPLLRTCFHVGGHYEFYQSEGLSPTTFSYIVGDVTIELARMIDQARDGQILIGDFSVPMADEKAGTTLPVDSVDFIRRTQGRLSSFEDIVLGNEYVETIKCYLTGQKGTDGTYRIGRYVLSDKHGYTRRVFNAKVNIHMKSGRSIYLGVQDEELKDFGVADQISSSSAMV